MVTKRIEVLTLGQTEQKEEKSKRHISSTGQGGCVLCHLYIAGDVLESVSICLVLKIIILNNKTAKLKAILTPRLHAQDIGLYPCVPLWSSVTNDANTNQAT